MKRAPSSSHVLADELDELDRTLRWTSEQKDEVMREAAVYQACYLHLKGQLDAALEARSQTFDRRHKISYETARDTVVSAVQTGNVDLLNGLMVATGNLSLRKLEELPTQSASEWTKWITAVVNNPLNVYMGLSKYNSSLGRQWDPRQQGNEFGTEAPLDRFEPGSPITAWQLEQYENLSNPAPILKQRSVLAAAWAIHDHYRLLADMGKGEVRHYFKERLAQLPHWSWGVTETRSVPSDDPDFADEKKVVLKDRPS